MRVDREHVLRDVGGATQRIAALAHAYHRNRSLRGDTFDVAAQIHVEHRVADHDNAAATSGHEQRREAVA